MGDAFTDQAKANREYDHWVEVEVPKIEKTLLGMKPEQLTVEENDMMYSYYRWKEDEDISNAVSKIRSEYYLIRKEHFDASLGQGDFTIVNNKIFRDKKNGMKS